MQDIKNEKSKLLLDLQSKCKKHIKSLIVCLLNNSHMYEHESGFAYENNSYDRFINFIFEPNRSVVLRKLQKIGIAVINISEAQGFSLKVLRDPKKDAYDINNDYYSTSNAITAEHIMAEYITQRSAFVKGVEIKWTDDGTQHREERAPDNITPKTETHDISNDKPQFNSSSLFNNRCAMTGIVVAAAAAAATAGYTILAS